mmetsp:Transcript_99284/g.155251  ORF Transcript_99284/g.155251 Transcript_99284/m.155251 type:complete len:266 (-) Transcript_99284:92-889(-)
MGNQSACCCSSDGELPINYDMLQPQPQSFSPFLKQLHHSGIEDENIVVSGSDALRTRLLTATRQDDAPGVLQCVADGADISDMSESLRLAAQRGSASVVRELVAVGLTVNEDCPVSQYTPLHLAAANGHVTVVELLLDALADVHRTVQGSTALNLARKMGNVEVEEVLERHVASLVMDGEDGGEDASQWSRRAHVLPRVSPVLSEAVLQALPSVPQQLEKISQAERKNSPPPAPEQPCEQEVNTKQAVEKNSASKLAEDGSKGPP